MDNFPKKHFVFTSLVFSFWLLLNCSKKSTSPQAEAGTLEVFSFPSSARIFLDGTDTGKLTPSIINSVPLGTHSLKLSIFTYFDTTATVIVSKGQSTRIDITLARKPLTETQVSVDGVKSQNGTWSPDGLKIAFDSNRNGGWSIFSTDSRGESSGVTQLTTSLTDDHAPDWSPDGSKIVFQSAGDIWFIDSRGENFGAWQVTTNPAKDFSPAWSRSNLSIAFTSERIGTAIWISSAQGEGNGIVQVTDAEQPSQEPAWSPDGNSIVYSRFFENNWDLWSIDLRLHPYMPYRLTRNPADDFLPSFSPDGSMIAFFSNRDGDSAIWISDSRGEDYGLVELVSGVEPFKPNWSPDGNKISFCRQDKIWVISGLK